MTIQNFGLMVVLVIVTAIATHYLWPNTSSPNTAQASNPTALPAGATTSSLGAARSVPQSLAPLITPEIRARFDSARQAVFTANPTLKTEEDDLNKQRQSLMKRNPPATAAERLAIMTKWKAHAEKMRVALANADPGLQPLMADLDAKLKERVQEYRRQGLPTAPTNSATPPPTSTSKISTSSTTTTNAVH